VDLTPAQRAEVEKIITGVLTPLGLKFKTEKDATIDSIGVYEHDSKTVGINFERAVETYAKHKFTKYDRNRETADYQRGDVISTKSPRNYSNYEDVIQYILSIVSHEVAHATQFNSNDYASQLPVAAVELSTIQLEQAVFKKLFPDRKVPIRQPVGSFRVSRGFSHDPSSKMQPFADTAIKGGIPFVDSMRLDEAGIKQLLGEFQVVAAGRSYTPRESKVVEHLRRQLAEFAAGRDPHENKPLRVGGFSLYAGPSVIPPAIPLPPRTTALGPSSGSPYEPIPIRDVTPVVSSEAPKSTTSVVAPRPAPVVTPRRAPVVAPKPAPAPVVAPKPTPAPTVAPKPVEDGVVFGVQSSLVRATSVAENLRKKNVFASNATFDIKPGEVTSEMEKSARNLLKSAGTVITKAGDKTGKAYLAVGRGGSVEMVLRAVEDLYHRTAIKTEHGEEYLSNLADTEVNLQNLPSIMSVIKQAITTTKEQGLRNPSEVLQLGQGAHLNADGTGVLTAEDIGKAAADDSDEGTPRSMVRNNSIVYYKENKTSTHRGQQSLRTAMGLAVLGGSTNKSRDAASESEYGREIVSGSQVVGFGTKDVFPPLVVDRVKQRIEEQERVARAQLAAGETTSMQVGTTTYDNVPRIIADSQLAIMRSAGRASEITGLTKLGNKHGPYGELEGNHSIDMLANLHLGKMFQSLTTTGEIPSDLTENFLLSTAAQESDPALLPDSVKPEQSANNLQVMAQRLKEKLAYYQRIGEENLAANADQSPSQLAMEEISSLAMQQRLLDELMTTAADPDEEKLRRKRRGQIIYPKEHQANLREANSHVIPELSSDQALFSLFGDSALVDAYPATFLNIREQAQSVKDYVHSTGGNTRATRGYDNFSSVARAVKAATVSDSRDADELYNSIVPEDYQAQLDSSGTSKAKMLDRKEVDVSHTSGMVEKDISYILNDMYGLSAQKDQNIFNAMYHASRATDEQGNLLDPAQLRASMGGTTKHGLESIHRGAQDLQDISRTGIPLIEYAKLRTQEVLPGQEEAHQQALDRIHAVSPALADLDESQVQSLSKVDYKQEASQVLTQIIKIVGTSIQKRVAEAVQKKGRAAGLSDDQLIDMFVDNKETGRVPAGFESLFRQFNLFNPATIESNPEFLRAMTLLMDVQQEAARGETAADFTARALGTTPVLQRARTAADAQSANVSHAVNQESYGLQASARTFVQDETGRAPRAIVRRQIMGAANLQKLQQELAEATAQKEKIQEQYDNASSTRKSLLGVELAKAIEVQKNANQAFLDAAHSADPTAVDVHFSRLSAIVASDGASPESRQAAMIELAASERIRTITRENPLLMRENVDELDERDMTILPGQTSYLGPESGYEGRSQVERLRSLEEHLRLVNAAKTAHPDSDVHRDLGLFESERNFRIANYQSRDEAQRELTDSDGFVGLSAGTNAPVTSDQRDIVQGTSLSSFISSEAMLDRNQDEAYAAPVSFAPLETAVTSLTEEDLKAIVTATPEELLGRAAGGQAAIEARRRAKEKAHNDGLDWLRRINPELKNRYLLTQSYQRTGRPLARDAYIAANPPANETYAEDLAQTPEYQHYVSIPSVNQFSDRADLRKAEAMMPAADTARMSTTERANRIIAYKAEQLEQVRNTPEYQRMQEVKDQDFGTIATPEELADARDTVQYYHGVDPATDEERFKLEKAKALRKQHAINLLFDRYDNKSKVLSIGERHARVKDFSEEHERKREELRVQSDNTPEGQAFNNIRGAIRPYRNTAGEERYSVDQSALDFFEEQMGVDKYDPDTVKQLEALDAEYKATKNHERRREIEKEKVTVQTAADRKRLLRAQEYALTLSTAARGTKEYQAFVNYPVYNSSLAGIERAEKVLGLSPQRSEPTEVLSPAAYQPSVPEPDSPDVRLAKTFAETKQLHEERRKTDVSYIVPDDEAIMRQVQQIAINQLNETGISVPQQTAVNASALATEVKKIAEKDRRVAGKNKRRISQAQLKTARGTQAELYGKEEMTQDERQRLSAAQEILRVHGMQTVRKNFGDDTSQGIPQLFDILTSITPQDWDTSPEAMQRRGVAGSVASIVDSLDPSMLALAKNADFTTSRGRNWLGNKDPRWKAIIAQLDSIPDIKKYTRSRDRGLRGAVRADAMTSVSDAAAKSVMDEAEGAGPAYFDLETNIPRNAAGEDDKSLKRTIFQASVLSGDQKEPTVMYAAATKEIAKQIETMAAEANAADDPTRRDEIIKQMRAVATTDVYGKTGKDVEVNADVIQSLVAHALAGGTVYDQETIKDQVKARISDATQVIGHNVKEFDLPVLYDGGIDQAAIDTVPEDIMSKAVDTLALSRDISPGSHRLIDSYKRFVDPAGFTGAHDAGQDVLATRALHEVLGRRGAALSKLDMSAIPAELHPYITDSSKVGAGDPRAKQFAVLTGTYKALSTMEDYTRKHGVEGQTMDARTMENMEKMFPGIGAKTPEEAAELKKQIQEQYLDKYQHLAVDGSFRSGNAFLQRRTDFDKTKPYWGSYAGMRENLSRGLSVDEMVGAAAEGVGVHAKRAEGTAGTAAATVAGGAAETRRTGSRTTSYGAGGAGGGGGSGGSFTMSGGGDVPGGGGGGPIIIHVGRAEIYVQNGHVAGMSEGGGGAWPGGSYTGAGTGMDAGVESTDKDPDTGGSFGAGVAGAGMGSRRTGARDAYTDPTGSEASAGSVASAGPISAASLDGVTTLSTSTVTIQNATIQQVQTDTVTVQSTGGPVTVTAQFSKEGAAAYDKSLVYVKNTGDASIEGSVAMGGGRGGGGGPRFPASVTGILSQMDYDRATTAAKLGVERDPAIRASLQSDLMTRGYANMKAALSGEEFAGVRKLNVNGNNVGDLVDLVQTLPELAVPELNATNLVTAAEQQHQAAITAGADEDTIAEYAAVIVSARQFTDALRELNKAFQQTEQSSRTNAPYERGVDTKAGSTYQTGGLRKYNNEMAPYRGALNNIEVMRGYYTAQLSKEKDPVVADMLRAKMMSEFAGSAKGVLGHDTFADIMAMNVNGMSVQSAVDRVQHDPVTGLGMLNYMAEGMTTQTGSDLEALKTSGTATEDEIKLAEARNNKAHEFVSTLGEISKGYRDVTYSQKTTPPYDRTAGAGGTGGVGGVGGAGKRGVYDPTREAIVNSIEAARNAYDQSGGLFSGRNIFQSKGDLTGRTIQAAQSLVGLRQGLVTASGAALMAGLPNPEAAGQYAELDASFTSLQDAATIEQASAAMLQLLSSIESLTQTLSSETGPGIDEFKDNLQGLGKLASTGTMQLNKTAKTQQQTESLQIGKMEERVQAAVTQPGIFNFGRRREDKKAALRDFAEGFLGDKADTLYDERTGELSLPQLTETVDATGKRVLAIDPRGRRKALQRASDKDLQRQVEYLNQLDPSNPVTFESLSKTQRAYARAQQSQNQAPFADKMFYAASKLRDLQFFAQGIAGIPQIPQQIMQTIEMATNPALSAERTMTTARSLSLTPQVYNAALSAAAGQQARFGGSLSSNVGKITDFIPLTNAYGVDMTKSLNVARKLAAFDPAQGMQGASIALKEFLSGNVSSLSRRFEINRSALSKINTGDATEMLDSLDAVLSSMGVTDKLIDDQANTMATKYDKMVGRLETVGQNLSGMLVSAVTPTLESMLGSDSGVASAAGGRTLDKITAESMQVYGDKALTDKVTGLGSLNPYSSIEQFSQGFDNVLRMANNDIAKQALAYNKGTNRVTMLAPYRRLNNAAPGEQFAMQQSVIRSIDKGMTREQAYLQALRENPSDFNTYQEYMFQRNPLAGDTRAYDGREGGPPANLSTKSAVARIFGTDTTIGTMTAATQGGMNQAELDRVGKIADTAMLSQSFPTEYDGNYKIDRNAVLSGKLSTSEIVAAGKKLGTIYEGKARLLLDNDTIEIVTDAKKVMRTRLANIDAPESGDVAGNRKSARSDVAGRLMGITQADIVRTAADRAQFVQEATAGGMSKSEIDTLLKQHGNDGRLIKYSKQPTVTVGLTGENDKYGRVLGNVYMKKGDNLEAVNRRLVELGAAPMAFGGALPRSGQDALTALQANAANTQLGAVNVTASQAGFGAEATISQAARDEYFKRHYMNFEQTAGAAALLGGGLTLGGSMAGAGLAGMGVAGAGALAGGPAFAIAAGIAGAAGLSYGTYAYLNDVNDTSVAKQRELYNIQKAQNTDVNRRGIMALALNKAGVIADQNLPSAIKGVEPTWAQSLGLKIANLAGYTQTQKALDTVNSPSVVVDAVKSLDEEFLKRRETAPENQKAVYDTVIQNPFDKNGTPMTVLEVQQQLDGISKYATETNDSRLQKYVGGFNSLRGTIATALNPQTLKLSELFRQSDVAIPQSVIDVGAGPAYLSAGNADTKNVPFSDLNMLNYTADQQEAILKYGVQAMGSLRNYGQPAKEYVDNAMGKSLALRNQRFNTFVDANAMNAMFMGTDFTKSATSLRGTEGVKQAAENMLNQSYFTKGAGYSNENKDMIRTAQRTAVDAMLEQARAFREQADMARPFTTVFRSTFANLVTGMNIAGDNFRQIYDTMAQGNPLFAIDFAKQSTGLDWKQSIASQLYVPGFNAQGAENALRPGLMAGTFQTPYATGPRASIQYASDLYNDKKSSGMLNPAEMLNIFQSAAQGQTELVRRQIQFNNQMRDLNLNHNRALEDIARNGMRQLEDIHINYTRQMIQLTQQNEITKRMDRATVNKSIESADITQADRVQAHVVQESGQMFARHAGQSNPAGFLARIQGTAMENDPQVVALREALAKYNSISYDDSAGKQSAWDKVIEARNPLEGKIKQMMQGATPQDTANYESYLALLGRDPAREAQAQTYSNQRTSQFVETAAERKSLLKQKEELLYQQSGEGLTRRQLQKGIQDANASGDPLQIAAARKAMDDFDISSQKTADAVALVSQKLSAISNTSEMFADAWTEAFLNIKNNASTTVLGLVQSLDDFNRKMQQQLDDQDLQFGRQIHDLKQAFIDAAREIATQIPGEMAKGYTAVMTYLAEQSRAESLMLSGNYSEGEAQTFANMNRLGDSLYGSADSDAKRAFMASLEANIPKRDVTATGVELPSNGIAAALARVNGQWALRVTAVGSPEDKPASVTQPDRNTGNGSFESDTPRTGYTG